MIISKSAIYTSVAVLGFFSSVSPVFAKPGGPTNTPTPTPVLIVCHEIKNDGKCEVKMRTSCTGKYLPGPCITPTPTSVPVTPTPTSVAATPTPTVVPEATLTPTPTPVTPAVPEFGLITGALALAASVGSFGLFKKKN